MHLDGDVAECGVYRGDNTYHYANYLESMNSDKKLFALDSFCGLPKTSIEVADLTRFDHTSLQMVCDKLALFKNVEIIPGYFDKTLPELSMLSFSCVIIDCDLYESYKTCLEFFYSRMVPGGIIVLDEYYSKKYPLAKIAVNEFMFKKPEAPELFKTEANGWQRWRIVKS